MNRLEILAIALSVCLFTGSSNAEESYGVAIPDTYLQADDVQEGDGWCGIFASGEDFMLEHVSVIEAPFHYYNENAEEDAEGVTLSVAGDREPVAIVRGLKVWTGLLASLRPLSEPWEFLYPGQSLNVTVTNWSIKNEFRVTAMGTAILKPGAYYVDYSNYVLQLSHGGPPTGRRQVLMTIPEFGAGTSPQIVWAGDLDRDARPDFIVNRQKLYVYTDIALFLSSAAKDGEVVGLVAEWKASKGC